MPQHSNKQRPHDQNQHHLQPISSECRKENSFDDYQLLLNKESIWEILPAAMSTKHCLLKEKAINGH